MDTHKTVLAALFLGLGILGVIGILIVLVIFFIGSAVLTTVAMNEPDMPRILTILPAGFGMFIATMIAITTIPDFIVAYGLFARRSWAMVVALIVGILSIPSFPLGTAVGAYAIFVFFKAQAENQPPPYIPPQPQG